VTALYLDQVQAGAR